MKTDKLEQMLDQLAQATHETPPPHLCQTIKDHIPPRLVRHRVNWETVNIVIDLRMSRSAAAAIIVIAVILLANLFAGRDASGNGMLRDGVLMIKYGLAGENAYRADILKTLTAFYHDLLKQGRDVTFYGDSADPADRNAIVMHWRLPNGKYRVVFNDMTARTVSPQALIRLQARMLQQRIND